MESLIGRRLNKVTSTGNGQDSKYIYSIYYIDLRKRVTNEHSDRDKTHVGIIPPHYTRMTGRYVMRGNTCVVLPVEVCRRGFVAPTKPEPRHYLLRQYLEEHVQKSVCICVKTNRI